MPATTPASSSPAAPPSDLRLQRTSRDADALPGRLAEWLASQLPAGASPAVAVGSGIDANGMSSETLVLDATWTGPDGSRDTHAYVVRVAPSANDIPVFARYDLAEQWQVMNAVRGATDVPIPAVSFLETTGEVLGSPFFFMDRIEGVIPPDVLPYNFGDNWLFDATVAQQRRLQDATVGVLARLHSLSTPRVSLDFLDPARSGHPGDLLLARNLARTRAWYDFAIVDLGRSALVERALGWLERRLPQTSDEEAVLCWGDARIGNVIYRDFEPAAVLDWEMATLGPRQLDVAWLVFAHQVFEAITTTMELPGMPGFLRTDDVVGTYRGLTGVDLGDLDWYLVYCGVQWCIVFMRTGARQIHFGEIERPDDIEALFHCKPVVEDLLARVGA